MSWQAALETVFGVAVTDARGLQGGDLSEISCITLADGRRMAVKRGPRVETEARMLAAMALAGAPVPEVLHAGDGLLCLQWLEDTPPSSAGWRALGVGLRVLHDLQGAGYGWPEDYAFGSVEIDNAARPDWPTFWAEARFVPQLDHLPPALSTRIERLAQGLPDRLPAAPAPALLHGDLWTGNALFSGASAYLIDPACYHGHGEVDLAMLALFGTPDPAFRDGYGAAEPGEDERRPVYQLWPALVHCRLFGAGYHGLASRLLSACGV